MNYKHLSQAKRYQILALIKAGHNYSEITKVLLSEISPVFVLNLRVTAVQRTNLLNGIQI